jgi:hypothetical protein
MASFSYCLNTNDGTFTLTQGATVTVFTEDAEDYAFEDEGRPDFDYEVAAWFYNHDERTGIMVFLREAERVGEPRTVAAIRRYKASSYACIDDEAVYEDMPHPESMTWYSEDDEEEEETHPDHYPTRTEQEDWTRRCCWVCREWVSCGNFKEDDRFYCETHSDEEDS